MARDLARGDRVAQRKGDAVAVAKVAHGGEAGQQRLACVDRGFVRLVGDSCGNFLQLTLDAGLVRSEVNVAVYQARQNEAVAQVDDGGILRHASEGAGTEVAITHLDHATIADEHRTGAARRMAGTVEQRSGLHQRPCGSRHRFVCHGCRCASQQEHRSEDSRSGKPGTHGMDPVGRRPQHSQPHGISDGTSTAVVGQAGTIG